MQPLINKYARGLYYYEYEDMQQELTLALIESVKKIEKFDEEGKTIKYLIIGIRNRFYELYRKQGEIRIEQNCEKEIIENMVYFCKDYSDLEFYMDLRKEETVGAQSF